MQSSLSRLLSRTAAFPTVPIVAAILVITIPLLAGPLAAEPSEPVETTDATESVASAAATVDPVLAESSRPAVANGAFDEGLAGWFPSHLPESTELSVVVNESGDRELNLRVGQSEGSVAQDIVVTDSSQHSYSQTLRASSPSGLPVLVELVLHGLTAEGLAEESAGRLVMVEGYEVPITVNLDPAVDYSALRAELYVHTIGRDVRIDDAKLLVDATHHGPANYGYQQPRVRYLNDVDPSKLEPGQLYMVEISVGSTSDQPWACCDLPGPIRLGTEDEDLVDGSDRESALYVAADVAGSAWSGPNRIDLGSAAVGPTGERYGGTFTTYIKAPTTPGLFSERFRLVADGVTWIPGPVIELIGSVVEPEVTEPPDSGGGNVSFPEPPDVVIAPPPTIPQTPPTIEPVVPNPDFVLGPADVGPGHFTVEWHAPETLGGAAVDSGDTLQYVVDLWHEPTGSTSGSTPPARRFVTDLPSVTIDQLQPGTYRVAVTAIGSSGQWGVSSGLDVTVAQPPPIIEVPVPPVERCPDPPASSSDSADTTASSPGLCAPGPISVPSCEPITVQFERSTLLGYTGWDRSEWVSVELACARYRLVLRSSDDGHKAGHQQEQTEERWYLEGADITGDVVYTSAPTPDLADDQTEAIFEIEAVELSHVVSLRARHLRPHDGANSVDVSVELIPID